MKAKKFVEKTFEGEYELIKHHVIDIDIDKQLIRYIALQYLDCNGMDPEDEVYTFGVLCESDGEPAYIQIGKFLDAIEERAKETEEKLEPDDYEEIQNLKPFRDYELWVKA